MVELHTGGVIVVPLPSQLFLSRHLIGSKKSANAHKNDGLDVRSPSDPTVVQVVIAHRLRRAAVRMLSCWHDRDAGGENDGA